MTELTSRWTTEYLEPTVRECTGRAEACWRAPGRVNLIGEHTDYNQGFALPFALADTCTARVSRHTGESWRITSSTRPGVVAISAPELRPGISGWAAYPAGVVWALRHRGYDVPGLRIALASTVPAGSGLSSSAALVCSVATAIDDLLGLALPPDELLAVTRAAENDFVGAPTGGMDQLAALRCTAGHALLCDMRSLRTDQVPFDPAAQGLAVLVINTRAEHRHSNGEYGQRRSGCERAAALLGVPALRDITTADLDAALSRLPEDDLRRYTRHVVTENERVLRTVELLRAGDLAAVGPLLNASHASMRDDYRITIPELDAAAEDLVASGALGARMTGGGFGGCVIGLLPTGLVERAAAAVRAGFATRGFAEPAHFTARPSDGAARVAS